MPDLALVAVEALRDETRALRESINSYAAESNRTKRVLRLLAVSIAFDITLSVGLGGLAIKADHAARVAARANNAVRAGCLAGNDFRKAESELWGFILSLPPQPGLTDAQKATQQANTDKFKAYVASAFAPRQCQP